MTYMTISKNTISIFLVSVLMLVTLYVCRTSGRHEASNIAFPTPPNVNAPDRRIGVNSSENISTSPDSRKSAEQHAAEFNRIDRQTDMEWRKLVRSTGLPDLKSMKLAPNDIEIRIWELPGLIIPEIKCWVFSRKDGQWRAIVFVDPESNGKVIQKPLDAPTVGWDKWNSFVSDFTPTKIREVPPDPIPENDAMAPVVEVKFGNDYAKNLIDHKVFLAKLFSMIRSEFFNDDPVK